MHRTTVTSLLAATAVAVSAHAQSQAGPAFEVASVKANVSASGSSSTDDNPGSYSAINMSLRRLIAFAYRMDPVLDRDRIVGPSWIDTARFDITARTPPDTPEAQIPDMLRSLLVERFKLAARTELRDAPMFALVAARSDSKLGPQLRLSSLDCSQRTNFMSMEAVRSTGGVETQKECGLASIVGATGGIIRGGGRTMAELAKQLTGRVNRSVIDRTGLTGAYDFVLKFTPEAMTPPNDGAATASTDGTSLFTALQEQLGLKLESQRGPVEILVIDRIERPSPD